MDSLHLCRTHFQHVRVVLCWYSWVFYWEVKPLKRRLHVTSSSALGVSRAMPLMRDGAWEVFITFLQMQHYHHFLEEFFMVTKSHPPKASLKYRRCHSFQLCKLPCCPFDTESGIAVQLVPIHLQLGQAGYPKQRGHQDDGTRWWSDVPWPVRKGWFLLLGKLETTRNTDFSCNSAKYRSPCAPNVIHKPWDLGDIQMLPRQRRKIIKHHWFWFPLMR